MRGCNGGEQRREVWQNSDLFISLSLPHSSLLLGLGTSTGIPFLPHLKPLQILLSGTYDLAALEERPKITQEACAVCCAVLSFT